MKERLDVLLVQRGHAASREKAKAVIMAGCVYVNGQKEDKAGSMFDCAAEIEVRGNTLRYVSRGGLKLEKAMKNFGVELEGKVCMDVGASTGGFTDCMLQNGAVKVYSVDVGHGQLDWKLRNDERVVCMEKTNIRYVQPEDLGEPIDFSSIDDMNGNPYTLESIESFIKDNERTDNAEIVYTILNTDAENLGELQDKVFKKANIHLEQQTDEMISEKPILETIPPDISMKRCLDFLVPKVKSYEDLKECLELIGFSIRDSMFNANTSVDDFMNNTKNMQFKVINMDSWKSTSNLKGFDGLDYSLQSILDRIEDNSRSESVSVVKDLLDCRSLDEIDVMVDRVLAMAHVKDDIPVEENKDVPDMEFINSLNTDQLNHYINHFAQDDKSLKYAKKRLKKMNISKQKTTSIENRKPTRVREDRTV